MNQRIPDSSMRLIFLFGLFCLHLPGLTGQNFYQVYGPKVIDEICRPYVYSIQSADELAQTTWTLIPTNGAIIQGSTFLVEIQFAVPGYYFLLVNSIGFNGQQFTDSLSIEVFD